MKFYFALVLSLSYGTLFCQSKFSINTDRHDSSIANARNLITLHNILSEFEDTKIKNSYWNEDRWISKTLGIGYRFSKTALLDFQVDYLAYIIQHEIFGHGYRFREFGYSKNRYNVNMFPPFGTGGGSAWSGNSNNRIRGTDELLTIYFGGIEANTILAKNLKRDWQISGNINYSESLLYFYTFSNLDRYIRITKNGKFNEPGNDILNYLAVVHSKNNIVGEENYKLTIDKLSRRSIINYFNTYQIFSVYAYLKTYLFDGKENFKYPTIKIGQLEWLPSIRYNLTPFGGEFIVENFVKTNDNIITLDLRIGDNEFEDHWGISVSNFSVKEKNLSFKFFGDIWYQPSMILGGDKINTTKKGFGGRIFSEINWYFTESSPIGLYSQIGYKSNGYVEGEILKDGLIVRVGISFK